MSGRSDRLAQALVTRRCWIARNPLWRHKERLSLYLYCGTLKNGWYHFEHRKGGSPMYFTLDQLIVNIETRRFFPAVIDNELIAAYTGNYSRGPVSDPPTGAGPGPGAA